MEQLEGIFGLFINIIKMQTFNGLIGMVVSILTLLLILIQSLEILVITQTCFLFLQLLIGTILYGMFQIMANVDVITLLAVVVVVVGRVVIMIIVVDGIIIMELLF